MEDQYQDKSVMTVSDWAITLFVTSIPIVGFIMLFVWGFSSGTNQNKANYAKGALILYVIMMVISILFFILFGAAIFANLGGMNY